MKIFKIEGQGVYAGGVVLALANNPEEAAALGNGESSGIWEIRFKAKDAKEVTNINYCGAGNEAQVLLHYELGE